MKPMSTETDRRIALLTGIRARIDQRVFATDGCHDGIDKFRRQAPDRRVVADSIAHAPDKRKLVHLGVDGVIRLLESRGQKGNASISLRRHGFHISTLSICPRCRRSSAAVSKKSS